MGRHAMDSIPSGGSLAATAGQRTCVADSAAQCGLLKHTVNQLLNPQCEAIQP